MHSKTQPHASNLWSMVSKQFRVLLLNQMIPLKEKEFYVDIDPNGSCYASIA